MIHTRTHVHACTHPHIHKYRYIHVRNYIRTYKVYENAVRTYAFIEPIGDSRVFRDLFFSFFLNYFVSRTFLYFIPRVALDISVSRFALGGWQNGERGKKDRIAENSKHHCARVSVNEIEDITMMISLRWMSFQNFLFKINYWIERILDLFFEFIRIDIILCNCKTGNGYGI